MPQQIDARHKIGLIPKCGLDLEFKSVKIYRLQFHMLTSIQLFSYMALAL